jgi:hypothetical protein
MTIDQYDKLKAFLTIAEFADILEISHEETTALINHWSIPSISFFGRVMIHKREIECLAYYYGESI